MSKLFKNFVGIDVSKQWFDVSVVQAGQATTVSYHQFGQTAAGYKSLMQWLSDNDVSMKEETLFCMEYTGIYNTGLVNYLLESRPPFG